MYKRDAVMSGVVSLTMGNSVFPFGDCLPNHVQPHGQFFLTEPLCLSRAFDVFAYHADPLPFARSL